MKQAFTLFVVLMLSGAFASACVAAPRGGGGSNVVIISTGDQLLPGYRVTVAPSGVISSVLIPRGRHRRPIHRTDRMIAVNRQRFFGDLAASSPLSGVAANSYGSAPQIYVRYQGRLSPNLRAASSASGQALYQDVKQILQVLRLPIPDVP